MKQFKALLTKEWQTHWKSILIPAWFLAACYALIALVSIYSSIRFNKHPEFTISAEMGNIRDVVWFIHFAVANAIGFLATITAMQLSDHCINHDHARKCEIFHMSQPVSLIKMLGVKLIFIMLGSFIIYMVLALLNSLVMSLGFLLIGYSEFAVGLNATLISFPYILLLISTLPPLMWFFASIFRKNAFGKMLMTFLGIEVVSLAMRKLWNLQLFSPNSYYYEAITKPLRYLKALAIQNISLFTNSVWTDVFSLDSLYRVLASVVMLILSYFLIKRREVR